MPNLRPLSEDLQKNAIDELNEVPERLEADLRTLRDWIEQQPHLRARTDDQFLVAFLRGCKFSLEKAKSKIDKYYTLKTKYPDFYRIRNVDDQRVRDVVQLGIGLLLPTPLHDNGPRIILIRPGIYPADKYSFEFIMGIANGLHAMTLIEDDVAMINGIIGILDFKAFTASHLMQMTPTIAKKMSTFTEEAMPLREKAMHMINTNGAFETVFNMLKPLMPPKQQERLYVHANNLEALYQHIPQKYLPKEYGGENGSIPELIAVQIQKFNEFHDYFVDELNYGTDEKLRIGGLQVDYDNVFGVDGSFRRLNVD